MKIKRNQIRTDEFSNALVLTGKTCTSGGWPTCSVIKYLSVLDTRTCLINRLSYNVTNWDRWTDQSEGAVAQHFGPNAKRREGKSPSLARPDCCTAPSCQVPKRSVAQLVQHQRMASRHKGGDRTERFEGPVQVGEGPETRRLAKSVLNTLGAPQSEVGHSSAGPGVSSTLPSVELSASPPAAGLRRPLTPTPGAPRRWARWGRAWAACRADPPCRLDTRRSHPHPVVGARAAVGAPAAV